MSTLAKAARPNIEQAIATMLSEYSNNEWLLKEYWPMNEPHVRLMISDSMARFPPGSDVRLLDVGCFNGYISLLFKQLGYCVTGTDAWGPEDSDSIFNKFDIDFVYSNMNDLNPFEHLATDSFDIIIIAQVIEHILNYPLGLIRSLADLMRSGGLMILTTPNPATIMGATRVLKGRSLLWGTRDFISEPKIAGNEIITKADIHYREYTNAELSYMLTAAGLQVEESHYLGLGITRSESTLKKMLKGNLLIRKLMTKRLLASNHYFLARKP